MKTIEVLGQIIRNYPGKIKKEQKILIIREIHNLGMKTLQLFMQVFSDQNQELIVRLVEKVKNEMKDAQQSELVQRVQFLFALVLTGCAHFLVHKVASSISHQNLQRANSEALLRGKDISGRLVICESLFNCMHICSEDEIIEFHSELIKSKNIFADHILTLIVWQYLMYNNCGYTTRDRLCIAFRLRKDMIMSGKFAAIE
jgi:hypothetical protein